MAESAGMRFFTVDEARALVPRLRALLTAVQLEKRELEAESRAFRALTPSMRGNGHAAEAARHETRIQQLAGSIRARVAQIARLGVEVKDIDAGLVDFPSLRDGRVVYLCWRVDEPTVAFWHELDTGFRGRQPLDE